MNNFIHNYNQLVRPTLGLIAGALFAYLSFTRQLPMEAITGIIGAVIAFYFASASSERTINKLSKDLESERSLNRSLNQNIANCERSK